MKIHTSLKVVLLLCIAATSHVALAQDPCQNFKCPPGQTCFLTDVVCESAPCLPIPACQASSTVSPPSTPTEGGAVIIKNPCDGMICRTGHVCKVTVPKCKQDEICPPKATCVLAGRIKQGRCPGPISIAIGPCVDECTDDDSCPGSEKCCPGCPATCKLPEAWPVFPLITCETTMCAPKYVCRDDPVPCETAPCPTKAACHLAPVKPGSCPVMVEGTPCRTGHRCGIDDHCEGDQKCCGVCGMRCVDPVTTATDITTAGTTQLPPPPEHLCSAKSCAGGYECRLDPPKCKVPGCTQTAYCAVTEKEGQCPKPNPGHIGICVVLCNGDSECPGKQKCCNAGGGCPIHCVDPEPEIIQSTMALPETSTTTPTPPHPCQLVKCRSGYRCIEEAAFCTQAPCPQLVRCVPMTLDCSSGRVVGPCGGSMQRWNYNPLSHSCESFMYSGCGGNSNNYGTESQCQRACKPDCSSAPVSGMCKAYMPRWYYSAANHTCQRFIYGGCGGNGNNYDTESLCNQACQQASPTVQTTMAHTVQSTARPTVQTTRDSTCTKVCPAGRVCKLRNVFCFRGPCPPVQVCVGTIHADATTMTYPIDRPKLSSPKCQKGGKPLAGVFCGLGPNRQDCPSGYECNIHPTDRYAVCCPTIAKTTPGPRPIRMTTTRPVCRKACPAGEYCKLQSVMCVSAPCPPIEVCVAHGTTAAFPVEGPKTKPPKCKKGGKPFSGVFCGRGPNRQDCPSGYECIIHPTDRSAVCCPTTTKTRPAVAVTTPAAIRVTPTKPACTRVCPTGQVCVLQTVVCIRAPCHPIQECVAATSTTAYPLEGPSEECKMKCRAGYECKLRAQTWLCRSRSCREYCQAIVRPGDCPRDDRRSLWASMRYTCDGASCSIDYQCGDGEKCCHGCCKSLDKHTTPGQVVATTTTPVPCTKACPEGTVCKLQERFCFQKPCTPRQVCEDLVKNGSCPSLDISIRDSCPSPKCARDYDCPGSQKCCGRCPRQCTELAPVDTSTQDKPGRCLNIHVGCFVNLGQADQCQSHSECEGELLCCTVLCRKICTKSIPDWLIKLLH